MLFWINLPLLSAKKEHLIYASQCDNNSTTNELRGHAPKESETELNFRNDWINAIKQRQVCESWKDILTKLCILYKNLRHNLVRNTQVSSIYNMILIIQSCYIHFVSAVILKWSLGSYLSIKIIPTCLLLFWIILELDYCTVTNFKMGWQKQ